MNHEIIPEHKPQLHEHGIVDMALIALIPVTFLLAASIHAWGFMPTFYGVLSLLGLGAIIVLAFKISHHRREGKESKHLMDLATKALAAGHSVQVKHPTGHELATISPLTIPDGPLTIKDVTLGGQAQLPPVLPVAPPFSQIAEQVGPGHLFLGQGAAGPIWGDITSLLSTVIAGRPGTGKSTNLRSVCGQLLIIGGKPILMDPHGSILDQLGTQFDCAESPREIAEYAHWLDTHLEQRLRDRRAGQRDFKPLLLLADEMPNIHATCPDALPPIKRIISEGRKVAMFALIAGVGVPASLFGGTFIRDSMASRYVFNTSPQQARLAGLENETAKTMMAVLESAGPGKAVLATSNRSPEIVAIPYTSTNDIRQIVQRKRGNSEETDTIVVPDPGNISPVSGNSVPQPDKPMDSRTFPVPGNRTGTLTKVSAEERERIIRLAKTGIKRRKFCKALGKGNAYYETVKQVLDEEGL